MEGIVPLEVLQHGQQLGFVGGVRDSQLNKAAHPVADKAADLVDRARGEAVNRQPVIEAVGKIGHRVEYRAVKVKYGKAGGGG